MTVSKNAEYLGGGLFADFDGNRVKLYGTDGFQLSNVVFLEPLVLQLFLA